MSNGKFAVDVTDRNSSIGPIDTGASYDPVKSPERCPKDKRVEYTVFFRIDFPWRYRLRKEEKQAARTKPKDPQDPPADTILALDASAQDEDLKELPRGYEPPILDDGPALRVSIGVAKTEIES